MDYTEREDWLTDSTYEKLLGTGSFGFVFQAKSPTNQLTAVKICFLEYVSDSIQEQKREKERVLREFQLMKETRHENLVNILNYKEANLTAGEISKISANCLMEDSDAEERFAVFLIRAKRLKSLPTICIEMELCGQTLRHWINSRHHGVEEASIKSDQVHIIQDLIKGLGYVHKKKIMHRDLRPENIMFSLSASGFGFPLKIGDFGLCRITHGEKSMTGSLTQNVGMVEYRAPEVDMGHYTEKADLFSFGLIMWEVLLEVIKGSERRSKFQKLVYDNDQHVVQKCNFITNAKEVIEKLTRAKPNERPESIFKVQLLITI